MSPITNQFTFSLNIHVTVHAIHHVLQIALLLNVTLGHCVSIPLNVTVTAFVVSPSVIFITHVSLPVLLLFAVYVKLFPFILQLPLLPCVFTLALIVSQLHALALLCVFQFTVVDQHTLDTVKLLALNATSVHVIVALFCV